jgi:hypothetical protein
MSNNMTDLNSHKDSHSTNDAKTIFTTEQVSEQDSASQTQKSDDEHRTLLQNVKRYRKISWITLSLASAILLYGYDNVVVGTISAMPQFQYVQHIHPRRNVC